MCQIVHYFLRGTSVLSFYLDMDLTLSIKTLNTRSDYKTVSLMLVMTKTWMFQ